ncbi:MAG: hypothetical protein PHS41_13330, partial [Victivallaceae bacterium]|nr:hypothetical protein [Victivallaceae bacterium]
MLKLLFSFLLPCILAAAAPAAETICDNYTGLDWKSTDGTGHVEMIGGKPVAVIEVPKGSEKGQHWLVAPVNLKPY